MSDKENQPARRLSRRSFAASNIREFFTRNREREPYVGMPPSSLATRCAPSKPRELVRESSSAPAKLAAQGITKRVIIQTKGRLLKAASRLPVLVEVSGAKQDARPSIPASTSSGSAALLVSKRAAEEQPHTVTKRQRVSETAPLTAAHSVYAATRLPQPVKKRWTVAAPQFHTPLNQFSATLQEELFCDSTDWVDFYHPSYIEESMRLELEAEPQFAEPPELTACSHTLRMILVDWLALMQVHLKVDSPVLHMAVRIFDMVLANRHVERKDVQLVVLTSMWIASKVESLNCAEVKLERLRTLCKGSASVGELCMAERHVLHALDFKLPRNTTLSLLNYQALLLNLPLEDPVMQLANLMLDIALMSWEARWKSSPEIASAALLTAFLIDNPPTNTDTSALKWPKEWERWKQMTALHPMAFRPRESVQFNMVEMLQLLEVVQRDKEHRFDGLLSKHTKLLHTCFRRRSADQLKQLRRLLS